MQHPKALYGACAADAVAANANLRALNAAIDAILAAEAGHGFALAANTAKALAGEARAAIRMIDPAATFVCGLPAPAVRTN